METGLSKRGSLDQQGAERDMTVLRGHERGREKRCGREVRGAISVVLENFGQAGRTELSDSDSSVQAGFVHLSQEATVLM